MTLDARKVGLAREILDVEDTTVIESVWLVLRQWKHVMGHRGTSGNREIGFLKGKAKVVFHDDWEMSPEELGMV